LATRAWPRGHGRRWTRRRARCCDRSVVHRERAQSVESFPRPLKACPSRLEHPATGCSRRSGDASDGLQVLSTAPPAPRRSAHDEACRTFSVGSGVCWRWGRWSGRRSRRVRGAPAAALSTAGCAEHLRMRSHRTPRCWRQPPVQDAPRGGLQALADGAASPMTPTPRSARLACTRVRGSCRGFGAQDGGSGHRTGPLPPSSGGRPRPEGRTPVQRTTTATYRRRPLLSPGLTLGSHG